MSADEWRFIPGSTVSQVSTEGRVRERRGDTWVSMREYFNPRTGRPQVNVKWSDGRRSSWPVHRLVGEAWLGPRPEHLETRHLNGDPFDNRLANLVYGTHSENMLDQVRHGTHAQTRKTHCSRGHALADHACINAHGHRICRECGRERTVERNAIQRAERIASGWDPDEYLRNRTAYWAKRGGNPNATSQQAGECKYGHDLSEGGGNLRISSPGGKRVCRACEARNAAAYRARKAARVDLREAA